jgi:predicted HD superfamily hydrolase involved in NAD metabolism
LHLDQEHRFAHTLRVAQMAEELAAAHDIDTAKARTAALLHDLARLYSNERLLRECAARAMPMDDFERAHPVVLHARLGAELARELFDVTDSEVLGAIAKHTLGAAEMSPLECVVFLADGLEPERAFPERAALASLAMRDLPAAMHATLRAHIGYLHTKGLTVAPQTAAALVRFGEAATGSTH